MTTDPFDLAATQIEWLIIPGAAAFPALEAERTGGRADLAVSQPPDRRSPTERAHLIITSITDGSWGSQRPSVHMSLHITA